MHLKRCDIGKFDKIVANKYIVCYGIGNEFDLIIKNYSNRKWVERIRYLIDGNPRIQGGRVSIGNNEIVVESVDYLEKQDLTNVVIMPTCASFCEVIDFLNGIEAFKEVDCYVFHNMFNLGEGIIENVRQEKNALIPPVIHYCWFGRKPIPDIYKRYIESWHKFCPGYSIVEWNEDNCDINETAFTAEAYKAGKYGFVPDYFRLKIIYEYGGIYLDTDVELLKSLDDLRYNVAFCGTEFPGRVAFGLGFGAVKKCEVIKKLLEYYLSEHFMNEDGTMCTVPSPVIQSQMLLDFGLEYGTNVRNIHELTVYPVDVLSTKNPYTGEVYITDNSYSIHHFDGTWLTSAMKNEKQIRMKNAQRVLRMTEMV